MKCPDCNGSGVSDDRLICYRCGGMGEVKETNFDRITKTPEALAEFIVELVDDCTIRHECGICHSWCDEKVVTKWLKQESESQ